MKLRATFCVPLLLLGTASCNLWPGELGDIDLPHDLVESPTLAQRSLAAESVSEPETVEEAVSSIQERQPTASEEDPRVIREVGDSLAPMSVADLRVMVLRNNLDLDVALMDPEIAAARVSAEEGRFDAVIGSRFNYRRADTPPLNGPLVDFTSDDPQLDGAQVKLTEIEQRRERADLGLSVSVPLPTGGEVVLESLLNEKNILAPEQFDQYLAATRLSFSQPLLRNAGADVNLASIRMARVDRRITQARTKLAAMRILSSSEKAYWRLYASRRFLEVRSEQFRVASENLELVKRRVAEGLSPTVEITRAEAGIYQRLEALVVAETDWRLRQRDLKGYLASESYPLRGGRMIEAVTDPLLAGLELDPNALVARAMEERLDLIELELGVVKDTLRIGVRENQVLPIVNLDFSYGILGRDSSFGRAFSSQWDFDNPDAYVGVSFEMPFTNQRSRARLDEATLVRAQRLASKKARELMVRGEVLDMVDIIAQNWQRVIAARQNVIVSGVNYEAERRQFAQGMRTMREVLEALSDLGDAQMREIRAIVDYQVAQIDLAFATGTLLGYSRVDLATVDLPRAEP